MYDLPTTNSYQDTFLSPSLWALSDLEAMSTLITNYLMYIQCYFRRLIISSLTVAASYCLHFYLISFVWQKNWNNEWWARGLFGEDHWRLWKLVHSVKKFVSKTTAPEKQLYQKKREYSWESKPPYVPETRLKVPSRGLRPSCRRLPVHTWTQRNNLRTAANCIT